MQTIYLDISNKSVVPTIYAKQGDVGRKFEVIFTNSGLPYVPPDGSVFSVWYSGQSGEGNYTDIGDNSAFSINENKVTVELIAQMLTNDGSGILCIVLNESNGNQIGSWNIPYLCEKVPGIESEGAKEYYTAFSKTVESLKQVTENLTPEAIGAAPAGYGYGDTQRITFWNDTDGTLFENYLDSFFDDAKKLEKVYRFSIVDYPACLVTGQGGFADVMCSEMLDGTPRSILIVFYGLQDGVSIATKKKLAGTWQPWEYVNPPMISGAEYRTTERFNGKPVYCRQIDGETLPIGTKSYKVADNASPFHVFGPNITTVNFGGNIPSTLQSDNVISCFVNGDSVLISCGGDRSSVSFFFVVKYTKTTD